MTKRDIVIDVSRNADIKLNQQEIMIVIQASLDSITRALARSETVELRNFGVFDVVTRKPRMGRNPRNPGVDVPIPAKAIVKFRPGKDMREKVGELPPADFDANA
ncbi:MAG: HU family DNA-binding protein [Verrucomicrobiota bacterium]|jgi:DNA-binding protein HU-beta/integration host factor subunit alpha|nr:HU family DNA-binding protein [Verrucomicrobiota bacterium]